MTTTTLVRGGRPVALAAATALALSVALTGCSDKVTRSPASDADPNALLQAASDASKKLEAVHFQTAISGDVPNLPLSKAQGDANIKPQLQAQGTVTVKVGSESEGKFTYIDNTMYAAILGDKYVDYGNGASVFDVAGLFNQERGIPHILTKFSDAKVAGSETIDSQETTKIEGTVPATELAALTGSKVDPAKSIPIPTVVWVQSAGDKQLVRVEVTPAPAATVTTTFSKFGQKVTVTKPNVEPVTPTDKPEAGGELPR